MSNTCLLFFGKGNLRLNNWNSTNLVLRTTPTESEDQDLILGARDKIIVYRLQVFTHDTII